MKNRTLLFGEGLFETFRVYEGRRLAFVEDHLDRMASGSRFFGLPFSKGEAIDALVTSSKEIPRDTQARLRLTLMSEGDERLQKTVFHTDWEPLKAIYRGQSSGVKLAMAPFQRFSGSPLVRFKTTSYLENIFVFRWAREQGFFDALFTNEHGQITEGSITNVFFVSKDTIVTPPVDAGLLPGITRKQIIKAASTLGLSLRETNVKAKDLSRFDGAFVTNSVIEILLVRCVGEVHYDDPASPIIDALRDGYRACLEASFQADFASCILR